MVVRFLRFAAAAAAVSLLGAGCGDDGDAGGGVGDRSTTTATTAAPSTTTTSTADGDGDEGGGGGSASGAPVVEVLDAGAQPRQELRYAFAPGVELRYVVAATQETVGPGATVALTTSSEVATRIVGVEDGAALVEIEYGATTVTAGEGTDPAAVAEVQAAMDSLAGVVITQRIDDHGRAISTDADLDAVDPELAPTLEQLTGSLSRLTVGFPDEPLGAGARWRLTSTVAVGGVATSFTNEMVLVSQADGVVEVETSVRLEQSGLATGSGEGTGRSRIDLTAPLAEGESNVVTTVSSQGVEVRQRIAQRTERVG